MENLPPELLSMIKDHLNDVDSLSLRAVCRQLVYKLTPVIFSTVEVSYLPSSFQNLLNICSTPSLSTQVKTLNYLATPRRPKTRETWEKSIRFPLHKRKMPVYPAKLDAPEWSEERLKNHLKDVKLWAESSRPSKFYTEAELDAGYRVYRNRVEAQQLFETSYIDFHSLLGSMTYLSGLKSITALINEFKSCDSAYNSKKLSRTSDLVSTNRCSAYTDEEDVKTTIRQTTSLLLAIFSAKPKLTNLKISQILFSVVEENFERGISVGAFSHLERLELDISDISDRFIPGEPDHEKRQTILGKVLQSCKNLESLGLNFLKHSVNKSILNRDEADFVSWSQIFGDHVFPKLRNLSIYGIDIESSWVDFFPRHPQLRTLNIGDLFLLGRKSWVETFIYIKENTELDDLGLWGPLWWNIEDISRSELQRLEMGGGLRQLEGPWETEDENHPDRADDFQLLEGELTLGTKIKDWVLRNQPSPFVKENSFPGEEATDADDG